MIENKIKNVMANVFNVEIDQITDQTSTDTLQNWNSLGHMSLIIALEDEFGFRFKDEQVIEMISYPLVVCIINELIAESSLVD